MKVLVINGPNLNLLKMRDESHYGSRSLDDIKNLLIKKFKDIEFDFYQSNIEGEIVTKIQESNSIYDGLIINPAGYSHTSVSIHDALELINIPKIEVHLSHISDRENYRNVMITAPACDGYITGFKENSYLGAVYILLQLIDK